MTHEIAAALALLSLSVAAADSTVVGFDQGFEGWLGPQGQGGATTIEVEDGTPAPAMRTVFSDFGVEFRTSTNPAWIRDFTTFDRVTFSVNMRVNELTNFGGLPDVRPWLLELRDFDSAVDGLPWASVWFKFTDMTGETNGEWATYSVTIENPGSPALPAGWRGAGADDPVTFEPILPPGVTFAQILAGVDEVAYTTLEPGFGFPSILHDLLIDSVTVTTEGGEPGCGPGDLVEPFGVLDLADVQAFTAGFLAQDPIADLWPPFGVWDLIDVEIFISSFNQGCD